jgi:pentatricopeptide repeat protein
MKPKSQFTTRNWLMNIELMVDKKLFINIVIYDILIDVGKLTMARELFCSLPMKGMQPNVRTYAIMIKGLCQEGLIDEASELLDDCTYNTIIQGLLQHNETSKAKKYLQIMVDKDFSTTTTAATILVDLLSSNQAEKNNSTIASKVCVKVF